MTTKVTIEPAGHHVLVLEPDDTRVLAANGQNNAPVKAVA